jgi:hypothetical protein
VQRAYDVRASALALGIQSKWIDNLLSRYHLPGISRGRQGVQRRISSEGLVAIELARVLSCDLRIPIRVATELVETALANRVGNATTLAVASGISLVIDVGAIEKRVGAQVVTAMETVTHVRRGRPRRVI